MNNNTNKIEYLTNIIAENESKLKNIKESKTWLIEEGMSLREGYDDDLCNLNITWNYFKKFGYGKGTFKGNITFSGKKYQFKILDLYIEYLEEEIESLKEELKESLINNS